MATIQLLGQPVVIAKAPDWTKDKTKGFVLKKYPITAVNPSHLQKEVRLALTEAAIESRGTKGRLPGMAPNIAYAVGEKVKAKLGAGFRSRAAETKRQREAMKRRAAEATRDRLRREVGFAPEALPGAPVRARERIPL